MMNEAGMLGLPAESSPKRSERNAPLRATERDLVILDCDNTLGRPFSEVDDGLALALLLGSQGLALRCVTTTFGNGPVEEVASQTEQLLARLRRPEIGVHVGAAVPHGRPNAAAQQLVQLVSEQPGEITVLAIGPLSNLRAAAEIDREFFAKLKRIVCVGGYRRALRIGWRRVRESNFSADPAAARLVLNAPCPVYLIDADLCQQLPFGRAEVAALGAIDGLDRLIFWSTAVWSFVFRMSCGLSHFYPWDVVAAAFSARPDLFLGHPVRVRSSIDDLARGRLVLGRGTSVTLLTHIIDPSAVKRHFFEALVRVAVDDAERAVEPAPLKSTVCAR